MQIENKHYRTIWENNEHGDVAIIDQKQDDIVGKYYKSSLPPGIINVLDRYLFGSCL